jgi:uncharacterized damage-inducible protein DinB
MVTALLTLCKSKNILLNNPDHKSEVWQRGPVENIPPLLQPVAHALLQAREELNFIMKDFPEDLLWEKPAGMASVAFHLQHLSGVIDRLFSYAKNEPLTQEQLQLLHEENISHNNNLSVEKLISRFNIQVDNALLQLQKTDENMLNEPRSIGRKKIPTTIIGLLVHAAEHTMRHIGQLMVTAKFLKSK